MVEKISFYKVVTAGLLVFVLTAFSNKHLLNKTNPLYIDSAFTPFKPMVQTRWDEHYFYVSSNGIPNHNMMVGIKSWQQQVPLPQDYTGTNSWSIPLEPELTDEK